MMTIRQHSPLWAMAFRPLYPLAALYGALSVLLWGFGYTGTPDLPGFYWHAHEMVWGYAGLVVAAFLLTAVATWTGQPPTRGRPLMLLAACWLLARVAAFIPGAAAFGGAAGTLFFALAALYLALPVIRSRNSRNYIAVAALAVLGGTHTLFHLHLAAGDWAALRGGLLAGLSVVAGFIGLIGMRIMPFFTAKRFNTPQVLSPAWLMHSALLLPLVAALLTAGGIWPATAALCWAAAGAVNLVQLRRWWQPAVRHEPMLWILFAGYGFTALGLSVTAAAWLWPGLSGLGVHLTGVGGIGVLTLGMMARTALGHTGRPIYPAPRSVTAAFRLMTAAAVVRAAAALTGGETYTYGIRAAALLFAAALLLFAWRYIPWLAAPRADGKPG